jgi:Fe-S cluster assembly iron-binding protein IscA
VISFGAATLCWSTQHLLPTAANGYLRFSPWKYTLITLLLGWWCFPWGPPFAIHALIFNLSGRRKRTAASLLQLVEWGWDAPHDASATAHKKKIIEVSGSAAAEIRSRMANGGFSEELAVRITPTKWADSEVEIAFDYPISDGRDWVDESHGLLLLIDKKHESQLFGCRLDFADGKCSAIIA